MRDELREGDAHESAPGTLGGWAPRRGEIEALPEGVGAPRYVSSVVPHEDRPLRGWRRIGAELLTPNIWSADNARINPIAAYWDARRKGGWSTDALCLLPWVTLLAAHVGLFLVSPKGFDHVATVLASEFLLLPVLAGVHTAAMTGWKVRVLLGAFPFEELMTTPIRPKVIVQGMTIRTAGACLFGATLFLIGSIVILLPAATSPGLISFLHITVYSPILWLLLKASVEGGGAYATRAHFGIRDASIATTRSILDLGREVAVYVLVPVAVTLMLSRLCLGPLALPLLLVMLFGLRRALTKNAEQAMDWTSEHPEEWWINEQNEEYRRARQRSLFTKWESLME